MVFQLKKVLQMILCGVSFLSSLTLFAEDFEEFTEEDFLNDSPIISSVTRLKQNLHDIPASITIIDRKMIEASSAINVIELLRLVPGFQVGSVDGTESTATYHGLSSQHNTRLQILIDGRSIYDPTFGGALWYSLPITLDEIESIEVLRGPNAASYGANSFSAVVNIKTLPSDKNQGTKVSLLNGSRNTQRETFKHSQTFDQTSFRIIAEHESNTGYKNVFQDFTTTGTAKPLYDDHSHKQITGRIDHVDEQGFHHTFQLGFKSLKYGGGYFGATSNTAPYNNYVESNFQNYIFIKENNILESTRIQLSHNYYDKNSILFDPTGALTLNTSFRDHRYDAEIELTKIFSPDFQAVWGGGFGYSVVNSIGWLKADELSRYSTRVFGHIEYKQNKKTTWNLGGFLEYHENIGAHFSPRIAVNYHLNSKHTIRMSASQAYRMPSFFGEYGDSSIFFGAVALPQSIGKSDLEAEKMNSVEIGYLAHFFDDKVDIDFRLAKEHITNLIRRRKTRLADGITAYPANQPAFVFSNYGEAKIDSAELQLTVKPNNKTFLKFDASYTNITGYFANSYSLSGVPNLPNSSLAKQVPTLTTGALISYEVNDNFTVSSQYNFVEAYTTQGNGDNLEAFESINLKLSNHFKINGKKIFVSAIVRNIADEAYQDFENDNLVGLETYFQIGLELN